jgi:hypothetical protein
MSQFTPSSDESNCISRTLTPKEYETVIKEMESLGFHRGWIQNMESNSYYLPDFRKNNPFKE